jgi:hypothetical protein
MTYVYDNTGRIVSNIDGHEMKREDTRYMTYNPGRAVRDTYNELPAPKPGPPAKRIGNADRDRYVEHLSAMVADGFLKPEEFEERRDRALLATTKPELEELITDLPALPAVGKDLPKRQVQVRYQMMPDMDGYNVRFKAWRWVTGLFAGLGLIIAPGPLFSAASHGLDHAPGSGGLPILLIILGAVILLVAGIGFAPEERRWEDEK